MPVEIAGEAAANTLHNQPHRLARQGDKAFDSVNGMRLNEIMQNRHQTLAVNQRQLDGHRLKRIVVMG